MTPELQALVSGMTPEIYQNLKKAVEIGRWPDGNTVTPEQRANALQGVIAYEQLNMKDTEKTGFMPKTPGACGTEPGDSDEKPLNWQ